MHRAFQPQPGQHLRMAARLGRDFWLGEPVAFFCRLEPSQQNCNVSAKRIPIARFCSGTTGSETGAHVAAHNSRLCRDGQSVSFRAAEVDSVQIGKQSVRKAKLYPLLFRGPAASTIFITMNTSADPAAAGGSDDGHQIEQAKGSRLFTLALGSVGVVYGDIGTSPLYAMRESLKVVAGDGLVRGEVLGIVSLLLWSLALIVTIKYVIFLLRADNHGEGGILSLLTLVRVGTGRKAAILTMTAIVGAALFAGDAMITPAISVLSAVEGLKLVAPGFEAFIIPITLVILKITWDSWRTVRDTEPGDPGHLHGH